MSYDHPTNKLFDINGLENRIDNLSIAQKRTGIVVYTVIGSVMIGLIISAIIFQFSFGLYICATLGLFLIAYGAGLDSIDQGIPAEKQNADRIRVLDRNNGTNDHFDKFTNEYKSNGYYMPENTKNIKSCNFVATDTYLAFFAYGYMYLVPIESVIYAYGDAYRIKYIVTQLVLLFEDRSSLEIRYDEKTIIEVERFLLNVYGILVGFSQKNKMEIAADFHSFKAECGEFKAKRKSQLENKLPFMHDYDYPYSFLIKSSNPKRYTGAFSSLICAIIFLFFGLPMLILNLLAPERYLIASICMVIAGVYFLIDFFRKTDGF